MRCATRTPEGDGAMAERDAELVAFGRAVCQVGEQQGLSVKAPAAAAGIADGQLEAIEAVEEHDAGGEA